MRSNGSLHRFALNVALNVALGGDPISPFCFPSITHGFVKRNSWESRTVYCAGDDACRHAHGMCRSQTVKIRVVNGIPLFSQRRKTRFDKASLISVFYPRSRVIPRVLVNLQRVLHSLE